MPSLTAAARAAAVAVAAVLLVGVLASPAAAAPPDLRSRVVQRGLEVPWDVAFAPNGRMIVSERPGRIRVFASGAPGARQLSVLRPSRVRAEGEAGMMGLAVRRLQGRTYVYGCASRTTGAGLWRNQVLRWQLRKGGQLSFDRFIVARRMQANTIHNGCALAFGPDAKLWVTMGDAANPSLAQDNRSYNGKILRLNPGGSIPRDNPSRRSAVFSRGHRNPQGLAFHPTTGRRYAVEHGPDRNDEINRIVGGGNYGWPRCAGTSPNTGGADCSGSRAARRPAWQSGSPTIATSGAAFVQGRNWRSWRNDLFIANLKQADLRRFELVRDGRRARQRNILFDGSYGRLRAASLGPGAKPDLYVTTSNGSNDQVVRIRAR